MSSQVTALHPSTPAASEVQPAIDTFLPRTDALEYEDRLELHVELPGVDTDGVSLKIEDRTLSIDATRTVPIERLRHQEFSAARFRRSFSLPAGLDTEKVDARLENGVLIVTVRKADEKKPRRIQIR